jgi:hypothetical protein
MAVFRRQDVDRRVDVGMVCVSAGEAEELRLVFAVSLVPRPAFGAGHGRVSRIALHEVAAEQGQLVGEQLDIIKQYVEALRSRDYSHALKHEVNARGFDDRRESQGTDLVPSASPVSGSCT